MECYNHAGITSVALCKICSKGICRDCSQSSVVSIVCSDICARQAQLQQQVLEWSSRYVVKRGKSSLMSRQYHLISLTFVILALAIIIPIIYDYFVHGASISFSLVIFAISLLLVAFISYKAMPK